MPERCVAELCSSVKNAEKGISMHKIPFYGEDCPIKQKRRRKWIDFVLAKRKNWARGGGGYLTDAWVGRCGPGVQILTLFKTQFSDFPIPFKTEFKIFRPYLRHLTQNHTLFKTRMKYGYTINRSINR